MLVPLVLSHTVYTLNGTPIKSRSNKYSCSFSSIGGWGTMSNFSYSSNDRFSYVSCSGSHGIASSRSYPFSSWQQRRSHQGKRVIK
jgi:hypothetical protein